MAGTTLCKCQQLQRKIAHAFLPSPLVGEGGEVEQSETEPGEGEWQRQFPIIVQDKW
jgi:hypothetical protein